MDTHSTLGDSSVAALPRSVGLDALYEAMPAGLCQFDREFRFVRVNPALARMNGLPAADHLGRTPHEIVPAIAGSAEEIFRKVLATGEPARIELRGMTAAHPGEERIWEEQWYPLRDDDGSIVGVGAIVQDVTEARRAEQGRVEAERRFFASQEASTIAFTILNAVRDHEGRLVDFEWEYVNHAASVLLKRPAQHLVGKRLLVELPGNAGSTELFDIYRRVVETAAPSDRELRYDADGICGWFRNTVVKLGDGVAVSFTDITDQVHTREALAAAKRAAERANAAKDRFLAVLSHELRTPLTPAVVSIDSLLFQPDLPAGMREPLEMVQRNVALEIKLIDDLLDLSRVVSGKLHLELQPVDLNRAVLEAQQTCEQTAQEKSVRIECRLDESCKPVRADPTRLQQMLWNLLRNAVKFTPDGGRVTLTTRCIESEAFVDIADTGIGIDEKTLGSIFDAFNQGDDEIGKQFGGMGLGLAITKNLAEQHGGGVSAVSPGTGRGSTFTLRLPVASEPAEAVENAPRPRTSDTGALRVLLVEDHVDTAAVLKRGLGKRVRTVECAHTKEQALALCRLAEFDVIVSDIGLPDGTGYDLMQELRSYSQIPGVAMSGYGMAEDLRRSREAGFVEHLIKPVRLQQLLAALSKVSATGPTD